MLAFQHLNLLLKQNKEVQNVNQYMDKEIHVTTGFTLPQRVHMKNVIYLSLVTASLSFTITETKIFEPLREWLKKKNSFLGNLFSCGYCFGHWIAFALTAIYKAKLFDSWWLQDYFFTAVVIAWLAGLQWILMCRVMEKAGK